MQANESALWSRIRKKVKGLAERVENYLSRGMPDVYVTDSKGSYWIELKVCKTKTLQTVRKLLQPIQWVWFNRHTRKGVRAYVLIQHFKELYLYRSQYRNNSVVFDLTPTEEVLNGMGNTAR